MGGRYRGTFPSTRSTCLGSGPGPEAVTLTGQGHGASISGRPPCSGRGLHLTREASSGMTVQASVKFWSMLHHPLEMASDLEHLWISGV